MLYLSHSGGVTDLRKADWWIVEPRDNPRMLAMQLASLREVGRYVIEVDLSDPQEPSLRAWSEADQRAMDLKIELERVQAVVSEVEDECSELRAKVANEYMKHAAETQLRAAEGRAIKAELAQRDAERERDQVYASELVAREKLAKISELVS